jgi:mannose-6-phosphate isomerase-like protein (cupin superfamily)
MADEGYAVANLADLGEGYGFRKIRGPLGVEEFGVNAIVLPPRWQTGPHFHEHQQELYFCHRGRIAIEFGDGTEHVLEEGGLARVDAATVRRLKNPGEEEAVYLIVGAQGGYVGRDGRLPEGDDTPRGGGPIDA